MERQGAKAVSTRKFWSPAPSTAMTHAQNQVLLSLAACAQTVSEQLCNVFCLQYGSWPFLFCGLITHRSLGFHNFAFSHIITNDLLGRLQQDFRATRGTTKTSAERGHVPSKLYSVFCPWPLFGWPPSSLN